MPADQTATITIRNKVLPQLTLSTSPKEYEFTVNAPGTYKTVAVTCTAAWLWSDATGGVYYPIEASPNGYKFKLPFGVTSLWFKAATGAATLTPAVVGP